MKKLLIVIVLLVLVLVAIGQEKKEPVEKSPSLSGLKNDIGKEITKFREESSSALDFFVKLLWGAGIIVFPPLMMYAFCYQCKCDAEANEKAYRDRKEWEKRNGIRGGSDE